LKNGLLTEVLYIAQGCFEAHKIPLHCTRRYGITAFLSKHSSDWKLLSVLSPRFRNWCSLEAACHQSCCCVFSAPSCGWRSKSFQPRVGALTHSLSLQIARNCLLSLFVRDPTVDNYVKVSEAYKAQLVRPGHCPEVNTGIAWVVRRRFRFCFEYFCFMHSEVSSRDQSLWILWHAFSDLQPESSSVSATSLAARVPSGQQLRMDEIAETLSVCDVTGWLSVYPTPREGGSGAVIG